MCYSINPIHVLPSMSCWSFNLCFCYCRGCLPYFCYFYSIARFYFTAIEVHSVVSPFSVASIVCCMMVTVIVIGMAFLSPFSIILLKHSCLLHMLLVQFVFYSSIIIIIIVFICFSIILCKCAFNLNCFLIWHYFNILLSTLLHYNIFFILCFVFICCFCPVLCEKT